MSSQFQFFRRREMTSRIRFCVQTLVALILLLGCLHAAEGDVDWVRRLEDERVEVQDQIDRLVKYFCSYARNQRHTYCVRKLPLLREELRHIDDQLLVYKGAGYMQPVEEHDPRNLIRQRSFPLAEKELLRQVSEIEAVVREVYDERAENFNLLVDFASAVRDGELKFLVYKTLLEELIRHGHDDPLKVVRVIHGLQDEVVLRSSINDETLTKATNMVDGLKLLFESAVAKRWIDSSISKAFEWDTEIPTLADEISALDASLFTRIISKVVAGVYPLTETDQLMRNMEKFHMIPQLIDAFNAIYNEMARYDDIDGKLYILKLGYYFRELIQRSNSSRIIMTPEKKVQLQMLEQRLPASVRSLVFSDRICLRSRYIHDYLHIANSPRLRRYAFMAPGRQMRWIPKRLNYTVFFEFPYGGYLYADDDTFDGRNRLVATTLDSGDMVMGSEWRIEPYGDDCLIWNVEYDELLYVSEEFDDEQLSNKVFTVMESREKAKNDDRYKWSIEDCEERLPQV